MTDLPHLITRRDLSICSPTIRRLPRRLAGRMAHAYIAETPGVYQPAWTIEDVARRLGEIADRSHPVAFAPVPRSFYDHLGYSFVAFLTISPASHPKFGHPRAWTSDCCWEPRRFK